MNRKTNIILSAILVIAWMIVIFIFSAMPADESNNESMNIVNKFIQKFEAKSSLEIKELNRQAQLSSTNEQTQIKRINSTNERTQIKKASTTNELQNVKTKTNKESTQQPSVGTQQTVSKATLLKLNKLVRKFAHASVYFILYILVLNLIYQIKGEYKLAYCMISIAVCFIYACTDEIHQLFVEGRSGLFSDVIIDTIGATLGYLIVDIVNKAKRYVGDKNGKTNRKTNEKTDRKKKPKTKRKTKG